MPRLGDGVERDVPLLAVGQTPDLSLLPSGLRTEGA